MEPDVPDDSVARRIAQGLARIGIAMRHGAWRQAGSRKLTPTQAQILGLLYARPDPPLLGDVADALAITPATASEAVRVLVEKGLVGKRRAKIDARGVTLVLTRRGRSTAHHLADWPEFLVQAIDQLDGLEQSALLRLLIKMIRSLQELGVIPVQRMCVECRFFAPYVYNDDARPHHCHFVDAPFGDGELRIDCPDMEPVAAEARPQLWRLFVNGKPAAEKRGGTL